MSDSESHLSSHSATTSRDNLRIEEDEGLDDHRHQPSSLPLRSAPSTSSQIPQNTVTAATQPQTGDLAEELPRKSNRAFMTSLRTDYYNTADADDDPRNSIPLRSGTGSSFAAAERRGTQPLPPPPQSSILLNSVHRTNSSSYQPGQGVGGGSSGTGRTRTRRTSITGIEMKRKNSFINSNLESDIVSPMTKMRTNDSNSSERTGGGYRRERRTSRSSIDSDQDSRASRSSQETEEDVCFPMSREHVRINGIDFDEIEEFIKAEREEEDYMKAQQTLIAERTASRINNRTSIKSGLERTKSSTSTAAMKYAPKNILRRTATKLENLASGNKLDQTNDRIHDITIPANLESSTSTEEDEKKGYTTFAADNIYHSDDYNDNSYEGVKFGGTRTNDPTTSLPERFSFFLSESDETVHAADIPSLVEEGQTVRELFRNGEGTWWLDCVCPTDSEMKMIAKAFGIHPLTAEDIRMQETREKVELFRSYYFVCFHTFEPDKESEDYLEPINVYIVVFKEGILSFHFAPLQHPGNVRRRVRQLRDYVDVSADWLCYALIDDITDEFAPVITAIEYEADAIEDAVFVTRDLDFSSMLQRIGEARRKVMTLMRLLSGKADVIKMFAKRCQDEALHNNPINSNQSFANLAGVSQQANANANAGHGVAQPRADIALYLGDIQDHILTMFQNLNAYEKIFSRSHANYLAQLQVESFNSNNKVTEMLSKVTLIGTALVPLNLITGLFGMNVHVPGMGGETLQWFFGIIGVMVFLILLSVIVGNYWLKRVEEPQAKAVTSSRRSIKSLGLRRSAAKSIISFPNKYE